MFTHSRILIIGLGSMGKRRIRNLQSLGDGLLTGFDVRPDRCKEANALYGIPCHTDFTEAQKKNQHDAWIISVQPDLHHDYMERAVAARIPAFIEASVVDDHLLEILAETKRTNALLVPSCTLWFHPAVIRIARLLQSGGLGKISNIIYHSGQYLPDWHTYESVKDYYVSKKSTGGAREIVPFELTWLTRLLGFPKRVAGMNKKTITIEGAESIDDTYNLLLDYGEFMVSLVVDVVSRYATRRLLINGSKKQLTWNWDENFIRVFDPVLDQWNELTYEISAAEKGYHKNLTEQMYVEEMRAFLNCAFAQQAFPHSLEEDLGVLHLLYKAEASSANNKFEIL